MPTSTFFNLPSPKQNRLIQAAVEEFTKKSLDEVSINRIIHAAEIPRGSFYQYFEDKMDLFRYVVQHFSKELENLLLECLNTCCGRLMDMPLEFYDRVVVRFRTHEGELHCVGDILRQNAGLDIGSFADFSALRRSIADRLDLSGLDIRSPKDLEALSELLWESTIHALALVCCGMLTERESRDHLARKVALIRRGVEIREEFIHA